MCFTCIHTVGFRYFKGGKKGYLGKVYNKKRAVVRNIRENMFFWVILMKKKFRSQSKKVKL